MVEKLCQIISQINHCNLFCDKTFSTMWIHDEDYDNELRYALLDNKSIIVSRVQFAVHRSRCMSACFDVLKQYAAKEGFKVIQIQSVLTYEMMCWCRKHGFTPKEYNMDIVDEEGRMVNTGDYDYPVLSEKDNLNDRVILTADKIRQLVRQYHTAKKEMAELKDKNNAEYGIAYGKALALEGLFIMLGIKFF